MDLFPLDILPCNLKLFIVESCNLLYLPKLNENL